MAVNMAMFTCKDHIINIVTSLCLLNVLAQCGAYTITLEVDKAYIEENQTATLTCTTDTDQGFMQFLYTPSARATNPTETAVYVIYNTTSRACYMYVLNNEVVSDCSCENSTRYICNTQPLTRHNIGDAWFCLGANIRSNTVHTNIIVRIQTAQILENITELIDIQEGELVKLTCESTFGNPAANITWYLDNKTPNVNDDDTLISSETQITVSANIDRTYNTSSFLMFNPSRNEDGMSVYCNASNMDSKKTSSRKLILNVTYKPDTGILINNNKSYTDFYMIRNSPTIQSLQCEVRGGKPFANLTWSCYEGNQTNANTTIGATSNITWIAGIHNESVCICKAAHILGWSDEKKIHVHVLYPSSEPTCTVGKTTVIGGAVNVTLASNFTMTCTSDANPEPNIFLWSLPSGQSVNGQDLFLPSFKKDDDGIYVLYIQNTMSPSIGYNINGSRNATFSLRVHYHPMKINFRFGSKDGILINNTRIDVIKDDIITLACVADGHPLPNYTWIDSNVGELYQHSFTEDTEIVCHASNTLFPTGYGRLEQEVITSAGLQVNVLYPATHPIFFLSTCTNMSFEYISFIKVDIDEALRINCSADGNPLPAYLWSENIQSSQLYIKNVSRNHTSDYFCTAHNTMKSSYGKSISSSMTSSVYLDVLYPPKITNLNKTVEVLEGVNFSFTCDAEPGNPNVSSFSWTSIHHPERNTSGQYLKIQNISLTDGGVFTCIVQNILHPTGCPRKIGTDTGNVYIDVQYKASIQTFSVPDTTVHHGDTLNFTCEVDSYPAANISIVPPTGSTLKFIHGNNRLHYSKKSSCLQDMGLFSCVSANKYNRLQPDRRNVTVDVKCAPMYKHNERPSTVVSTILGGKAVLYFTVFSNPSPSSMIWKNLTNNKLLSTDYYGLDRVTINTTDDNSTSVVTITNIGLWDLGEYSVIAENDFGILRETFRIELNGFSHFWFDYAAKQDLQISLDLLVKIHLRLFLTMQFG
ncbi:hemicentin-1-like isoform X2 [Mya arenaria]|uniref:hemicentin-1-like isoform X2 n=1 Tax=Mya arenaria TaxID=6604 RepID=UPI0022DF8394|nr:hemicentin-1-like isoform X2 [Mya arenaria]